MTHAGGTDPKPYSTGERVFGPPNGTFDADWAATALRSNRPELDHATSVRLVEKAWDLLRSQGLRGGELADALDLEPGLASAVSDVATETARFYLDR
ncbi:MULTISPECIES: hypothetical protein [Nocardiaceae]|uniref:Uncharacterized protein n=1 Tax=Rhodococcoides corynebacterioides TaxID=53972 RepID=A0ABS2KQG8_9NOCA|nr:MULTISPECIES: hypothetical protein [Rhodococcus]MBM7413991.1 hypothetical protein [Rhodococcus corynebacterioides]MBP1116454.1 hypothetical protein [Rhodococcus sp. PvP016]